MIDYDMYTEGEMIMGIFKIDGNAKKTVNYDVAVINIEFVATEKTSFTASAKVMEYCEMFLGEIEKAGMNPAIFTLEDDTVSEENYRDDDKIEATRNIQVKVPFKMEIINAIRDILDYEKYDFHFNLDYELSNEDELKDELLKEALLDSKKKAEQLAETLGMKVKGIESVETDVVRYYGAVDWMLCEKERGFLTAPERTKSNVLKAKEKILSECITVKWIID